MLVKSDVEGAINTADNLLGKIAVKVSQYAQMGKPCDKIQDQWKEVYMLRSVMAYWIEHEESDTTESFPISEAEHLEVVRELLEIDAAANL